MEEVNTGFLVRTGTTYSVRPTDIIGDEGDILRLCRVSSLGCSVEKYQWNYQANPLRPTWSVVIVDNASRRIIGTTALFPRRLVVNGKVLRAAVAGDFAVERECRVFYPAFALQKTAVGACNAGEFDVLYGFPNDAARPVQLRAGYRSVGHIHAGVRLLRTRAAFAKRGRRLWWPWAADAFDSFIIRLSRNSHATFNEYSYALVSRFDERFDRFWAQVLPQQRIVVGRDSLYANWRYVECPTKKYSLFAAAQRSTGEIAGYILSWTDDGKTRISDIMAYEAVFDDLLTEFIRLQREGGVDCITISYLGGHALIGRLRRFGFFFRRTDAEFLVYTNPVLPTPELLFDPNSWYLLDGDSDA
jgi:hypothetical protein